MERQLNCVVKKNNPTVQSFFRRFFQTLITWTVYFLFRPKIIYKDKSLKKRLKNMPCVFVANHTHHFDGAFVGAVLWRYKPWVLVKKSWYDKKNAAAIRWCRTIPIDLEGMDAEWYEKATKIVENGGSLMIFPEGGLAREGYIQDFKAGAALLSAKQGIPMVPCAIYGTYSPVFGMRQKIIIGEPIMSVCPNDMRYSKYAAVLAEKSKEAVTALYGELVEKYGDCGTYKVNYGEKAE